MERGSSSRERAVKMKTPSQLRALEELYAVTTRPSVEMRQEVMRRTGLTLREVAMWFANRRYQRKRTSILAEYRMYRRLNQPEQQQLPPTNLATHPPMQQLQQPLPPPPPPPPVQQMTVVLLLPQPTQQITISFVGAGRETGGSYNVSYASSNLIDVTVQQPHQQPLPQQVVVAVEAPAPNLGYNAVQGNMQAPTLNLSYNSVPGNSQAPAVNVGHNLVQSSVHGNLQAPALNLGNNLMQSSMQGNSQGPAPNLHNNLKQSSTHGRNSNIEETSAVQHQAGEKVLHEHQFFPENPSEQPINTMPNLPKQNVQSYREVAQEQSTTEQVPTAQVQSPQSPQVFAGNCDEHEAPSAYYDGSSLFDRRFEIEESMIMSEACDLMRKEREKDDNTRRKGKEIVKIELIED